MSEFTIYDDDKSFGVAAPLIGELKVLRGDASEVNDGKIHVVLFCAQYDKGNYPAVTAFSGFQKKYPDVVFHGILIDPDEAKCMKFLTSKEDPTAYPPDFEFAVLHDPTKKVAEAYKEVSKQAALTVPTCFIIGKDGKIAWRERFGQNYIVERSDFGVQLEAVVGGKPLKSNGNRPKVEGEDVEEEAEGDFDMGF